MKITKRGKRPPEKEYIPLRKRVLAEQRAKVRAMRLALGIKCRV